MIISKNKILRLTELAMLTAISFVFILVVRFPFGTSFLYYDAGDIPILIAAFAFGPLSGLAVTAIVAALQALFLSADGWIGFVMHFIATGTLVMLSGSIYKSYKSRKSAVIGLALGTIAMTAIMVPSNYLFTGLLLYGIPAVTGLLPVIILFNLFKAGINSIVVFLIYKPLTGILVKQ